MTKPQSIMVSEMKEVSGDIAEEIEDLVSRTGGEDEPSVLGTFADTFLLGLFGGCNGATWIFRANTDTKQETVERVFR